MNPPAGFWRRYAAYSLDLGVVGLLASPLLVPQLLAGWRVLDAGIVALQTRLWDLLDESVMGAATAPDPLALLQQWANDPALRGGILDLATALLRTSAVGTAIVVAVAALWFIGFESSRRQATPGKRLLGMRVTDGEGGRASRGRIALRFVAGTPSWLVLHVGHAMAGWNRDKRALHDLIAGTRVLLADDVPAALPAWARSWLLLQAALVFGFLGFVLLQYAQVIFAMGRDGVL